VPGVRAAAPATSRASVITRRVEFASPPAQSRASVSRRRRPLRSSAAAQSIHGAKTARFTPSRAHRVWLLPQWAPMRCAKNTYSSSYRSPAQVRVVQRIYGDESEFVARHAPVARTRERSCAPEIRRKGATTAGGARRLAGARDLSRNGAWHGRTTVGGQDDGHSSEGGRTAARGRRALLALVAHLLRAPLCCPWWYACAQPPSDRRIW
jgi:hypothetical protein